MAEPKMAPTPKVRWMRNEFALLVLQQWWEESSTKKKEPRGEWRNVEVVDAEKVHE